MDKQKIESVGKYIIDCIKDYPDIKDTLLKDSAIEILGDYSKVVKSLVKLNKLKNEAGFKSFLKGFNIGDEIEEEKIKKLQEYIENDEDKAFFISNTLQNILNSKSRYSCFILGYMINTLISENRKLNPKYIILADALTHMFDHDIKNVKLIGDYINYKINDDRDKGIVKQKRNLYYTKKFKDVVSSNGNDIDIFYLTLEKCITYQLMLKEIESSTDLDLDGINVDYDKELDKAPEITTGTASATTDVDESYTMTTVGNLLYDLIILLEI